MLLVVKSVERLDVGDYWLNGWGGLGARGQWDVGAGSGSDKARGPPRPSHTLSPYSEALCILLVCDVVHGYGPFWTSFQGLMLRLVAVKIPTPSRRMVVKFINWAVMCIQGLVVS